MILPSTGTFNREYCFGSLCFEEGARYALTIEYNPTTVNELVNIDSVSSKIIIIVSVPLHCQLTLVTLQVVLRPAFRDISAHYMSQSLSDQTNIDLCLSQTLLPNPDPSCQLVYFQLSVEFYGQVFGEIITTESVFSTVLLFLAGCEGPSLIGADLNSSSVCHPSNGSYICHEGFTGKLCDQCQNGLYNYTEDSGCQGIADKIPSQAV